MTIDRRQMVLAGIGAGAAGIAGPRAAQARSLSPIAAPASEYGVRPDSGGDQTEALQRAIDRSAQSRTPLLLPAGTYLVRHLALRPGSQLLGVAGQSVLRFAGGERFLTAEGAGSVRLQGLVVDGAGRPLAEDGALMAARDCADLAIRDCRFANSGSSGVALHGCAGSINDCVVETVARTGIFSLDAKGLEVAHNHVRDCGNNGIQIWRSSAGEDGSLVIANRIERIRADAGGSGQNGNGINIFRAASVIASGNRIADCAFSAIRGNAASNCQMLGNSCARLGEVALYAEFGFEGSVIANNLIDGAAAGISVTNFNDGGRLAVAQGNLIRNLFLRSEGEARGVGISAEADTMVVGNVIEAAPSVGILLGWGRFLRDVVATGNTVRRARIGIGVSTVAGAGYALITNNLISGASEGAIRAMNHDRPLGRDLVQASAEAYRNIAVFGNVGL